MTRQEAVLLVEAHIENQNLRRHCYAVGYVMKALAEKLGGDPEVWETLGILHDSDWEETKDAPHEHTTKTLQWLSEKGITDGPIVRALRSHNRHYTKLADIEGIMEWSLETCDELTGFIVAVALTRPEPPEGQTKLGIVTVESILKKWKTKEFAKAVDRVHIEQCEQRLGIPLHEFITIALQSMQKHQKDLGF